MVRHIVMWNFRDGLTEDETRLHAKRIKSELEALASAIEGVLSLEVIISPLKSGNRDLMLNSLFATEEALASYQTHPEHVRIGSYIGTVLTNRSCMDYFE